MKEKLVWAVCLVILGLAAALGLCRLLWAGAPDAVVRVLGVVMLPVFAFVTVRLARGKKD